MSKGKVIREPEKLSVGMPELSSDGDLNGTEEAGTDVERLERQSYEKGFREGEKAGYEIGLKKAEVLVERFRVAVEEMEKLRNRMKEDLEPMVFSMAMAVAKAIIKEEITARQELMKEMIKEAVRKLAPSEQLNIKLHPALKDLIEKYKDELHALHESVKVEIDPSVPESSAVVVTPEQEVPLDVDTLISNLLEEIKEKLSRYEN